MIVRNKLDKSECKKYRYLGGHSINDDKLIPGKIYYIKNNDWNKPCIYLDDDTISYVLSDYILKTLFEEVS